MEKLAKIAGKKGVVYTCITGDYDKIRSHGFVHPEWDYVFFTDNEEMLAKKHIFHWRVLPLPYNQFDNIKNSRWPKIIGYNLFDYEHSLYIDGNIEFNTDYIFRLIDEKNQDMFLPKHRHRDCIYEEMDVCVQIQKDTPENVDINRQFLLKKGMPAHYGLTENGLIYRRVKSELVKKVMEDWWNLYSRGSHRDQLSFTYALWNNGVNVSDIAIPDIKKDRKNFFFKHHGIPKYKARTFKEKLFGIRKFDEYREVMILGINIKIKRTQRHFKPFGWLQLKKTKKS